MSGKETLEIKQIAALFNVGVRTVRRWADLSEDPLPVLRRGGKGRGARHEFDPNAVFEWGLRQRLAAVVTDDDGQILDYTQERAKLAREQRRKVALEANVLSGRSVPADEVTTALERVFSAIRARLLSIPCKAAPVAVAMSEPQIEHLLTTEIHAALSSIATATLSSSGVLQLGTTLPPDDPERDRPRLEH